MNGIKNEQESFWAGKFGDEYIDRNKSKTLYASNLRLFSEVLNLTRNVESISEYGCNVGMNLRALQKLRPECLLHGIDINQSALELLNRSQLTVTLHHRSILEKIDLIVDFSFTKGVLIHVHPDNLHKVYDNLYNNSRRYILIAEYYDPKPVTLTYRGHKNKMFKRDFAGEMLDKYYNLSLVGYGFCYHRDPAFPQDDISWFLLEKV